MFFSKKAGGFSGVPQSTVQIWTEKGLINATETTGTGDRRQYDKINCIQIGIVKSLRDRGVSLKDVEFVMKNIIPRNRLEKHLKKDHSVLILRSDTDRVIQAPQKSVMSFSDKELNNEKTKINWFYSSWPVDCEEVRVVNLTRIAKRVLKNMEDFGV